ncbi:CheR family methyltransferase [Hufsiella ginkgonis]|uniref:Chemotaxis protein CheR n=1 Tax=Hufsiella ginkgonis TaxID=2695274 RepID=A0A7K1Y0C5_9SPHI|nr:CheR family methyltransferase [Hufsiella ginkgonis]MXV16683.1 chemotaxis protein CheR [Hufsiella ginkgonis]
MLPDEPHHIVAIGASAGGIEEIVTFFDHTPLDGVAYVVIQHIPPDFKSRMAELLSKHSKLEIEETQNGTRVLTNRVYLIPSGKVMTIRHNRLCLADRQAGPGPHLPIDAFFSSLAANSAGSAIAVILSGLGSDGTEGARAIRKEGGIVMVRNPETAPFGSMPLSVIGAGLASLVLEPALMPEAIEEYVKYAGKLVKDSGRDEKNIAGIVELIRRTSPLDFSGYKPATIIRRTKRRAAQGGFNSLGTYFEFLQRSPDEVKALAKDFLIGVTSFFRDAEAFSFIEKKIIPGLLEAHPPGEEFKMWVAGCATGEEAYSLAILVCELLTGRFKDIAVKIFATDIDGTALMHAGRGVYSLDAVKGVPAGRLERHFFKEGDSYKIKPEIRRMVIFAQHDLVKNPPYCNMQLISCRNLLIYMSPILQEKVFNMINFGLKKGGCLFLGSSESPLPILNNLEVVSKKWKIYKSLAQKHGKFDSYILPDPININYSPSSSARVDPAKAAGEIDELMHNNLAAVMDYVAICIDENKQVLRSYGDTTRYLLQKNFTRDLEALLPGPLALAFNTLMMNAVVTAEPGTVGDIGVKRGTADFGVTLSVTPLDSKTAGKLFMVTLRDQPPPGFPVADAQVFDERILLDQYTKGLEEEVRRLKDLVFSAAEQLDASNENLQSFNEELLSANEEMQSTNEEMQSVNEELQTINTEYQSKNKELLQLNDDLNNYFRSNVNGQLFVDRELRLMKFSPGTIKLINLLDSDIGRPLSNISTNIRLESIVADIEQVIHHGGVVVKEIETTNGNWYQSMAMPYVRQPDHEVTGAILTFVDITLLKNTQRELDIKSEMGAENRLKELESTWMKQVFNSVIMAQEDERRRIAEVLHNEFGQLLSIAKFQVPAELPEVTSLLDEAMIKVRKLCYELVPPILEDFGLQFALVDMVKANLEAAGIGYKLRFTGLKVRMGVTQEIVIYRMIQELLNNVVKHSSATEVVLSVSRRKQLLLCELTDNGVGMPDALDKDKHGFGLNYIISRVHMLKGKIDMRSSPGAGTSISISLKLDSR